MMLIHIVALTVYAIVTFLAGRSVLRTFDLPFKNKVMAMLTGHLIITSAYALYQTSGHTFLMVPVLLLIVLCSYSAIRSKNLKTFSGSAFNIHVISIRHLIVPTCLCIIAYLSLYFKVYTLQGELHKIHADYTFYGGIADYMNQFHIETMILDPLQREAPYQIYHYFELWNAAFFANVFSVPGTQALLLLTYPFHLAMLLTGVAELVSAHSKSTILIVVMITLFIAPLGSIYNQILVAASLPQLILIDEIGLLALQGMKLFGVYILALLFTTELWDEPSDPRAVFLWGILLFIYPTIIPFAIVFLFFFYTFPFIKKTAAAYPVVLLITLAVALSLMALLNRAALFYAFYEVLRYLICFPVFCMVFLLSDQTVRSRVLQSSFAMFTAIFIVMLGLKLFTPLLTILQDPSIFQLIMNFAQPASLVLSVVILFHFISEKSEPVRIMTGVLVAACYFVSGYHVKAFNRSLAANYTDTDIVKTLSDNPNEVIAFERDPADYDKSTSSWSIYFDIPVDNTRWFSSHYFPVPLTLPDPARYPGDIARQSLFHSTVTQSSFYQFGKTVAASIPAADIRRMFVEVNQIQQIIYYNKND